MEAGKHYGYGIVKEYSKKLTEELGKGYTFTALTRMRKFYLMIEKLATLSQQLTYGHYIELLPIDNLEKIKYYVKISEQQNLSIRQLRDKIKKHEYERLPAESKNNLMFKEESKLKDLVKDHILIKNGLNYKVVSEKLLQKIILEDIEFFMKELGNNFCFVGSEYKIKIGNTYNYIDLLLYNVEYNCYVVIELKITELKKEHIGQIQVYMNYIDENIKKTNQDKTIGIIICKQDNQYIIKYCSDNRIISRTYQLI